MISPLLAGAAADSVHDDEGGRGAAGDVLFMVGQVGGGGDPARPAPLVGARRARLAAVDGRRVLARRRHAPAVSQGALGEFHSERVWFPCLRNEVVSKLLSSISAFAKGNL